MFFKSCRCSNLRYLFLNQYTTISILVFGFEIKKPINSDIHQIHIRVNLIKNPSLTTFTCSCSRAFRPGSQVGATGAVRGPPIGRRRRIDHGPSSKGPHQQFTNSLVQNRAHPTRKLRTLPRHNSHRNRMVGAWTGPMVCPEGQATARTRASVQYKPGRRRLGDCPVSTAGSDQELALKKNLSLTNRLSLGLSPLGFVQLHVQTSLNQIYFLAQLEVDRGGSKGIEFSASLETQFPFDSRLKEIREKLVHFHINSLQSRRGCEVPKIALNKFIQEGI